MDLFNTGKLIKIRNLNEFVIVIWRYLITIKLEYSKKKVTFT